VLIRQNIDLKLGVSEFVFQSGTPQPAREPESRHTRFLP